MQKRSGALININATVEKLGEKCVNMNILPLHSLSGCDTVSYLFRKATAMNILLHSKLHLGKMCDKDAQTEKVDRLGIDFLICLYGGKPGTKINDLHYQAFCKRKKST